METHFDVQGSDSWDGSSPSHTPGTNTGPWATLQHAIDALRLTIDLTSEKQKDPQGPTA